MFIGYTNSYRSSIFFREKKKLQSSLPFSKRDENIVFKYSLNVKIVMNSTMGSDHSTLPVQFL